MSCVSPVLFCPCTSNFVFVSFYATFWMVRNYRTALLGRAVGEVWHFLLILDTISATGCSIYSMRVEDMICWWKTDANYTVLLWWCRVLLVPTRATVERFKQKIMITTLLENLHLVYLDKCTHASRDARGICETASNHLGQHTMNSNFSMDELDRLQHFRT